MPHEPAYSAAMLRHELSQRAQVLARSNRLLHDLTQRNNPVVLFGPNDQGSHGNFDPASYASICADPAWSRRLLKVHTAWKKSRTHANWQWMELDSANSSDALLMNIFCHPGTLSPAVTTMLGVDPTATPCFGLHPGVPLTNGKFDRTEIDLQLGDLYLEAKLTETSFQQARPALIHRYRDLEEVFDSTRLPSRKEKVQGYQLIRNVLAAYAANTSFCVLSDARRRDLIDIWWQVLRAVHAPTFTHRLKLLTWQELASTLPPDLQNFLDTKYGIHPA